MTEEELFCKLFPDYTVNGKPLSPYFDLFESGYEQAENRIEQLEKKSAELKADNDARKFAMAMSEKVEKQLREKNAELENDMKTAVSLLERSVEISKNLTKAKEIIENIIRVTWGEGWNYSLDWKVKAEQFISEVEND